MLMAQPLACFSVMMVSTVPELIWSNEVHDGLLRVVQLPLELQVMPADRKALSAWAWVILVPLAAAVVVAAVRPRRARVSAANNLRNVMCLLRERCGEPADSTCIPLSTRVKTGA